MGSTALTYAPAVTLFLEEKAKAKARRSSTVSAYKGLLNSIRLSGQVSEIMHQKVQRKLAKFKTEGAYNHHLVAFIVFFNCAGSVATSPTIPRSAFRIALDRRQGLCRFDSGRPHHSA